MNLESTNRKPDEIVNDLINKIIDTKGLEFTEHKFNRIVEYANQLSNGNYSSEELYSKTFPNLIPTQKGISIVFENAIKSKEDFSPRYHYSEHIYRKWLSDFKNCFLINNIDGNMISNEANCKQALNEFKIWTHEFPNIKGSLIKSNIKWDLGELPLNIQVIYNPKNNSVKKDILSQLEKHSPLQIVTINDLKNRIEIRLENSNILLTKKNKYPITALILQEWLGKFGISVSIITATYLLEYGMPYSGKLIPLSEILRYTNNGYGIIGLLAFELSLLITKSQSAQKNIELNHHPLSQSVVLALARLESYLNPNII